MSEPGGAFKMSMLSSHFYFVVNSHESISGFGKCTVELLLL